LEGIPTAESRISASEGFLRGRPALASTAFGQGELSVSPLAMALAAAAVANDGVVPDPYVVAEVRDAQGNVLFRNEPRPWKVAMSPPTARIINDMMVYSVEAGFAQSARIGGVRVAGKTGTAEVGNGAEPHAWFIGYAPADDPTIAVAVIREHAGQGSQEATPQARRVMQAWLSRR
jgi:peptidoglycan glycosyltransferase